jgi:hypothetical protein
VQRLRANASTFLIPGFFIFGAFWVAAPFMDITFVYGFVNALALAIGCGIVATYLPEVWETIRLPRKEISGGHLLVIGIVLAWLSSAERGAFAYLYRYLGEPWSMRDTLFQAFAVWVLVWAGVMHMVAKGAVHGSIPRDSLVRVGWSVAGGVLFMLLAAWLIDPLDQADMPPESVQPVRFLPVPDEPVAPMIRFRPPADFRPADLALSAW